jgi:hypothetical protein
VLGRNPVWDSLSIQRWEKERRLGKRRFIFINGVLVWGCLTALLDLFHNCITGSSISQPSNGIGYFVRYPAGGVFFGWWLWNRMEARYLKEVGKAFE